MVVFLFLIIIATAWPLSLELSSTLFALGIPSTLIFLVPETPYDDVPARWTLTPFEIAVDFDWYYTNILHQ